MRLSTALGVVEGLHPENEFLVALATVLCVAAVTTVLFQWLRQPVVLGYLIAGLIIGPHVPIPLVANGGVVHTLSEVGVVLLMYSLGLEFRLKRLFEVGPTAGLTAVIESSAMIWLGFIAGRLFGWTTLESIFTGAILAISSTTIIAKAFDEQGVQGPLRSLVLGVLIAEDLIAIVLMAILTAVASGNELSPLALALTTGRLVAFLVGLVVVGLLVVPRAMRAVVRLHRPETTLIASIGLSFAVALLAQAFGYSVALGAFLAGTLTAESGEGKAIEHLVQPVRDVFAAVFFVSVGMLLDPALIAAHWGAVAVLTALVVGGKILFVTMGAFLTGNGTRTSVAAGMSLAQIGEFSFIIAGLGRALGATSDFLYPVAVAVSALTTLLTPMLIGSSGPVASWVDRRLPRPLQTFATLYASWVEALRAGTSRTTLAAELGRKARLLVLDAALLALLLIGTSLLLDRAAALLTRALELAPELARLIVLAAAAALGLPFAVGIVRMARRLGALLADAALPPKESAVFDRAAAPRRALIVTLQLAMVLLVGAPLLAVTQPFLPPLPGPLALAALMVMLGVAFWRSATNLEGHVRAGAEVILHVLAAQAKHPERPPRPDDLLEVQKLLPGLGAPTPLRLDVASAAVGKTLAELNLRGLTGATVLAITRETQGVIIPSATERLRAGDVLALAGTHDAVSAATSLLSSDLVPPGTEVTG
jgi:CPA2 family monovalent cation:H+ antiporter-2